MSVLRVHKSSNYTVINNQYLRNKEMSLKAKGLLTIMLSLPDNWNYSINGLVSICKESKSAIVSAIDELKDQGHLVIEKIQPCEENKGRYCYKYHIYEVACTDFQGVENQTMDIQNIENNSQLNTNTLTTKRLSINENINDTVVEIINYLNKISETNFKATTKSTLKNIQSR